jgi:arsenate reductase
MPEACEVYFNPSCSKSREARALLEARGVPAVYREYLTSPPTRAELERVLALLGTSDPRTIMRTGEPLYAELALASATPDALLEALVAHPRLIERPIVILGDRAVIARPLSKLESLL